MFTVVELGQQFMASCERDNQLKSLPAEVLLAV